MKHRFWLIGALALATVARPALAQSGPMVVYVPGYTPGAPPPRQQPSRPIALSKVVIDLELGQSFGSLKKGMFCLPDRDLTWDRATEQVATPLLAQTFQREMAAARFNVIGGGDDLFGASGEQRADFLIGGIIRSLDIDICYHVNGGQSFSGNASFTVEWQIYDLTSRQIVDRYETRGSFAQDRTEGKAYDTLLVGAFADNVRAFAASGHLQRIVTASAPDLTAGHVPKANMPAIMMTRSAAGAVTRLEDAVGSTVVVLSGGGHGSGFLISSDGYFLTNYHVVGTAPYVKLRWSDGVEGFGEVIRSDKGRDVALIKGDGRGRKPFALRADQPQVGAPIFAIGAPLEEQLQGTVTRGIISATRVDQGYSFLQSDVSVQPGNSGGPVVDEKAQLVGIVDKGIMTNDIARGINFLIPANEAFDFLALKPAHEPSKK